MLNDIDFRNPSWKIEPKYSPKVLIGNWYEERMRTDRGFYDLNFNPRWSDRKPYASLEPDVTIQQKSAPPKEQPVKEVSGNYGLKEELEKKWAAQTAGRSRGGLNTTYSVDYTEWPRRSYAYRMPSLAGSTQQTVKSGGVHSLENSNYIPTTLHDRYSLVANGPSSGDASTRFSRHMVVM